MLISFEGIEGSGKSTQSKWLYDWLLRNGVPAFYTKEPGGSEAGQDIRKLLLSTKTDILPETELFLYLADRIEHINKVIMPELKKGNIVIVDRYIDSTIAYQLYGRGLYETTFFDYYLDIVKAVSQNCIPDLTFLFDLDVKIGLSRAMERNCKQQTQEEEGRFENENLEFHQNIRDAYIRISQLESRFEILDANREPKAIFVDMLQKFQSVAKRHEVLTTYQDNHSYDRINNMRLEFRKKIESKYFAKVLHDRQNQNQSSPQYDNVYFDGVAWLDSL